MKTIKAPKNSQLLGYPMKECTVAGGYKNARYRKQYGYTHYGVDFDDLYGKSYDTISPGEGTVIGVEMNNNSIGGVIVLRFNRVYDPTKNLIRDCIVRLYHNGELYVKEGQKVTKGQSIGRILQGHKWWNHIHMEIDWDTKYPFHTVQVSEGASKLLIRKGATASTLANPMNILVISKNQTAKVHPLATCADKIKDAPKYKEA